jgi:arginine exporter protein ArgO
LAHVLQVLLGFLALLMVLSYLTPVMQTPKHWRALDAFIASIMFIIAFKLASQGGWF